MSRVKKNVTLIIRDRREISLVRKGMSTLLAKTPLSMKDEMRTIKLFQKAHDLEKISGP